MTFPIVLFGWIVSLCLHEFSHAAVAYKGGDTSVREKGYLTFNPLKYMHPFYSLVLPVVFLLAGGLGLPGGAVYINRERLRSRSWDSAVSLAGPASNLLLALVLSALLQMNVIAESGAAPGLAFLCLLQISAILLNLIPIPPLDGYGAIQPFLKPALQRQLAQISGYSLLILFVVLWSIPGASDLFWESVYRMSRAVGLDLPLAVRGLREFMNFRNSFM